MTDISGSNFSGTPVPVGAGEDPNITCLRKAMKDQATIAKGDLTA